VSDLCTVSLLRVLQRGVAQQTPRKLDVILALLVYAFLFVGWLC
jgi:hypothetical protein